MESVSEMSASASAPRRQVGQVTPTERDEIKALFERKNGLVELVRSIMGGGEDMSNSPLYDKLVRDMGQTSASFQQWWDEKSKAYNWENIDGHKWEIDFESGAIFIRKA